MAVLSVCTANLSNLGSGGCSTSNPFLDPIALILTNKSFSFSTQANFATEAQWTAGITAGTVFPLQGIVEYEDQSEETQYYESPTGNRVIRRLGKYRFLFRFNKPLTVHRKLQAFRNADLRMFIVDSNGNIWGTNPTGTVVKGFQVSMFNPEKLTMPGADGTPAWTGISVDLYDPQEWNEYGVYVNPTTWNPTDLEALVDVALEQVGTAYAASLTVGVYYYDGYTSAGAVNKIGISGLAFADFTITGTGTLGIVDDFKDNGDGTYFFKTATLTTNDDVDLVAPSALASVVAGTAGLIVESTGAVNITVTPP
jgi:hypothetical protein